ncbi:NAD-dependent epimerase/dehydratase family protein [Xanthobacter sp. VTT E-85241]|uniref:NAD-dependent epimerase/dehydratase family protein n=1 Tax=Roseixanthobacter finlandensis TaxID=3119922 RepID=UPI0037298905
MTDTLEKTALVLGATGGIGGEVTAELLRRGWQVNALARDPQSAAARWRRPERGIHWLKGDAMDANAVVAAAKGARLIVHAVNPPGYRNWDKLVLPMLENTIAAARVSGARILLPGTVYNFGPDAFAGPDEDAPQNPTTRKGAIRVAMERRLRAVSAEGVRALIVRAGDFFGPHAGNNWFSQGLVRPGRPVRAISTPGLPGIGHQWAYLPDVARTMVQLAERADALDAFAVFHMDGHWDADGTEMSAAIRAASGRPDLKARPFPWWLVTLAAPFVTTFREMGEMRYLWRVPLRMNNARLVAFLGAEPHTPLFSAVRETLAGLGCLPDQAGAPQGQPAP